MASRDYLLDTLKGKRFALMGFDSDEADRIRAVAETVQAHVHTIAEHSDHPGLNSLAPFDACVVNISGNLPVDKEAARADFLATSHKPYIIIADRADALRHALAVSSSRHEFIIRPWEREDFLLRAFRVIRGAENEVERPARAAPGREPTIIIADDDRTTVTMVQAMLRTRKMNCIVAAKGNDALALTRKLKPDALLLDVSMPEMDGFEVLAALRNDPATQSIPVVMLTAAQSEADIVRGFSLGADDYVTKPFHPQEMLARLKRLLSPRAAD